MVTFVCDACGASVKKSKVDAHWRTQCRACSSVTCMDCGEAFPGDAYRSHTRCLANPARRPPRAACICRVLGMHTEEVGGGCARSTPCI